MPVAVALLLLASLIGSCAAQQTVAWNGKEKIPPVTLPVGGTVTLTWTAGSKNSDKGVTLVRKLPGTRSHDHPTQCCHQKAHANDLTLM